MVQNISNLFNNWWTKGASSATPENRVVAAATAALQDTASFKGQKRGDLEQPSPPLSYVSQKQEAALAFLAKPYKKFPFFPITQGVVPTREEIINVYCGRLLPYRDLPLPTEAEILEMQTNCRTLYRIVDDFADHSLDFTRLSVPELGLLVGIDAWKEIPSKQRELYEAYRNQFLLLPMGPHLMGCGLKSFLKAMDWKSISSEEKVAILLRISQYTLFSQKFLTEILEYETWESYARLIEGMISMPGYSPCMSFIEDMPLVARLCLFNETCKKHFISINKHVEPYYLYYTSQKQVVDHMERIGYAGSNTFRIQFENFNRDLYNREPLSFFLIESDWEALIPEINTNRDFRYHFMRTVHFKQSLVQPLSREAHEEAVKGWREWEKMGIARSTYVDYKDPAYLTWYEINASLRA